MKAILLLVNSVLPDDLKNYEADLTDKGLNKILYAVAEKHPDKFSLVLKDISDIGRKVSYLQGETLTLNDLAPVIDREAIYNLMEQEIATLPRDKDFIKNRRDIFLKYNEFIEKETSKNALANKNNIAISVLSGARGKSALLKAMISTPGTFSDYKGIPIDVFSKESFADGIRPVTFLASTYGARSSVISTKCLDYQSLVKMADLSEKKLCDIKVGDMVLGADKEGKVFPVKVLNVFDQGEKECYKYTFRSSIMEPDYIEPIGTVVCTKDHKFLNVEHGCPLPIEKSHKSNYMRPCVKWKLSDGSVVVAMEAEPVGKVHCMDIEVDHPDHLFVLANGLITSNSSTAKGGDLAKQMALSVVDMVVRELDCGSYNGIALGIDDESLKGRVLSKDTGPYKAGSFITREMIHDLKNKGIETVVARSPLTCNVHNGLCAKCIGKFYRGGKLPKIGESIGAMVSTSASEPVTLMALSAKHTAGMTSSKRTYSGLGTITQFTLSPEKFKDRAAVAETDGVVEDILEASQGGNYITINGIKHYVPAGHPVEVKVGDTVEAGDFLSEGLGDAEDVVKYKGLGAGRLYYANRLNQILSDSGAKSDKRSTEVLARGALRHVRIVNDEGFGNYLPDDVVDYNVLLSLYKVPETTRFLKAKDSIGKYLQAPSLHYTIGTKITPKIAKDLEANGYDDIYVDDKEPAFVPEMMRLRAASHSNPDWMASLGTSYLTKQLNESATKGDDTNVYSNVDYRPRLAFGKDFGKNLELTGMF